ncbi:MAG: prepilin-type N-terminal cleavage/methylation domain-containing protein [Candidatus Heimdallarchaeaceae archaeon]
MLQKLRNNKAFTLIEVLIVIAIIAILAAVVAGNFIQIKEKVNEPSAIEQTQPKKTESNQL